MRQGVGGGRNGWTVLGVVFSLNKLNKLNKNNKKTIYIYIKEQMYVYMAELSKQKIVLIPFGFKWNQ